MNSLSTSRHDTSTFQGELHSDRRFRLDVTQLAMIPGAAINQADAAGTPQRAGIMGLIVRAFTTMLLWRERAYSRRALATFDRRMLRDIGVSPYDAGREISKSFWRE